MSKTREVYVCSACKASVLQWRGQCPQCRAWNTLEAVLSPSNARRGTAGRSFNANEPMLLQDVRNDNCRFYATGLEQLDRALGRGLVSGASILVGGEPGIGKSTLLMQVAGSVAKQGRTVLYATGEESLAQIKDRAERLGVLAPQLLALATSQLEDVLRAIDAQTPELLILDSVQTMASASTDGLPGNASQVRAVATALLETCRRSSTTSVLVGHVTKDGLLAGPRLLEHAVDTVIALEGDRRNFFRLLRVLKNRFGSSEELLVFRMKADGMQVVDDPSTFFLEARDATLSGAALALAVDGNRPLVVEAQALVARSFLGIPRRTALGFDVNRLHLLLAVLEKRLNLNFGQADIYAKVGGGIRLQDPGLDLALMAAVLSSYYDVPLPEKCILWGEVDLNGQMRSVAAQEPRLAQALRLGYSPVIHPGGGKTGIRTIRDLQAKLFRRQGTAQ
ncbi:MAG: DNA repair protein RadA [Desulfovibrio sp.]|jgi:DNA repair protein RadA/Sms|nr:DNA repair protein RadA [Desulfovibrio sp.]